MKKMIVLAMMAVVMMTGCGKAGKTTGLEHKSMKEAKEMMAQEGEFVLVDVRTPDEYEAGHIPGAISIPNETIGKQGVPSLPDKDQKILVYCRSGNRSKIAAKKLVVLGYTQVVEIGGIIDWDGETVAGTTPGELK